ncbi:hypothetical protein FD05_GL000424 [Lentilactobacillus otakiensis DSM 19908 = JCM 15040]|nr:hypothetical protein FD05_GL000424 [Lentilactobacillus otakiensis DSM 19908 = JCM 15040]MBZ3776969.1 hypothetical protein [Lentilactobacillus otakiensis]
MVKQGRFARSSKMKQIKAIRKRMHQPAGRTIHPDEFENFVLVRYGLTLKKRLKGIHKETVQRFLQEMLADTPIDQNWQLTDILGKTLRRIGNKVPFQFYRVITNDWPEIQHFLQREIPAVPLTERIIVSDPVDDTQLQEIVSTALAGNTYSELVDNNPEMLERVKNQPASSLQTNLLTDESIDWQKVAAVFGPFNFDPSKAADAGTRQWLEQLMKE